MYHSITFGDGSVYPPGHEKEGQFAGFNTWEDWHLIPSTRPVVAQAQPSTNFVDIPGRREGPIDTSEYLTGSIIYGSRSGSFEFYVDNDHECWETIRTKIVKAIHGKRLKMVLEDDPEYYYIGRFSLNEWRSENWFSKVTINYALAPYKYLVVGGENWLWDPFNFETDDLDEIIANKGWL